MMCIVVVVVVAAAVVDWEFVLLCTEWVRKLFAFLFLLLALLIGGESML